MRKVRDDHKTDLYFESHVTIEPVFDDRLEQLKKIVHKHSFRVADLLMQKRRGDTHERSKYDTFCTARGNDYHELNAKMMLCVGDLVSAGFKVWRYKLENTLVDVRRKC